MKGCRPLTEAEVALVRQSFGGRYSRRDQALFLLGVKSGFRISELLLLRVGAVWQGQRVAERVTVRRQHMKRQTEGRTVLLALGHACHAQDLRQSHLRTSLSAPCRR
jgi:integrase